jgi:hypothetical protein
MPPDVQLLLQFVVGLTFLASVIAKLQAPALFFDGLRDYKMLPRSGVRQAGILVIAIESLIAFSYLSGSLLRTVGLLALVLLGSFLLITTIALKRGTQVKCLCFGASRVEPLSARTAIRILLLASVIVVLLIGSPERDGWLGIAHSSRDVLLALICALAVQMLASWTLAIPELARLIRQCRGCGRQVVKS